MAQAILVAAMLAAVVGLYALGAALWLAVLSVCVVYVVALAALIE